MSHIYPEAIKRRVPYPYVRRSHILSTQQRETLRHTSRLFKILTV